VGDFSHYGDDGSSRMVDISSKPVTSRTAGARALVRMGAETMRLIREKLIPKGNVFEVAKVAGILAAKRTHELIPMCHPLPLNFVDVKCDIDESRGGVVISSEIRLDGKTGAEMEALTAVTVAALTVYDMCKAVDKTMTIEDAALVYKKGGKSDFRVKD
jgi:cyclic pyranopterin monophosphate synthase